MQNTTIPRRHVLKGTGALRLAIASATRGAESEPTQDTDFVRNNKPRMGV
jgi:hypothetical protein